MNRTKDTKSQESRSGRCKIGGVMKRIAVALSLSSMVVGTWLITKEHGLSSSCSTKSSSTSIGGVSTGCMSALNSYFIGFALVAGGLIVLILAIVLMNKTYRVDHWRRRNAVISTLQRDNESYRDAA
jgi:hypothetical protein